MRHPATSVTAAVEGLACGGGDLLHGLADGLDVAARVVVAIEAVGDWSQLLWRLDHVVAW